MIQSQIFLMSQEAVWKADMAARRERVSRLYGKPSGRASGRRRVPALPVLHLPRRHRRAVAVA
jgi:hypothetical protein